MTVRRVHVSDHAVLRYLERFAGIDTEALRKMIQDKASAAAKAGAVSVTIDGTCFLIRDGCVVTSLTSEQRKNRWMRR